MSTLPHFINIAEDGVIEYYLDNTILSTARMCESNFILAYIQNKRAKGLLPWALNFGTLIHDCMEYLYKGRLANSFTVKEWFEFATTRWHLYHFEAYKGAPQYKSVGGYKGFIALLAQYYEYYDGQSTNIKCVALEVPFGKNKEVPLLEDHTLYKWAPFRLYLSGRLDFIFDDGRRIGPMDHKTFSVEGKNPFQTYEIQDGMTGYIYAMTHIYKTHFNQLVGRENNLLWLNMILTKLTDMTKIQNKFQRIPLYKTPEQLEDYRLRQISTCSKIHQLLFEARPPDYNTGACTNWYRGICAYQPVHRLASHNDQFIILDKEYKEEVWDTEAKEELEVAEVE